MIFLYDDVLCMQVSYGAFGDAGVCRADLLGSSTGIFVGLTVGEFSAIRTHSDAGVYTATGAHGAIASNRISYTLGLEGPSISVDTACSSSVVALNVACQTMRFKSCWYQ